MQVVTWSYNCLQKIIINNYLKPYNCVQTDDLVNEDNYLKPYNYLYLIGMLDM